MCVTMALRHVIGHQGVTRRHDLIFLTIVNNIKSYIQRTPFIILAMFYFLR